MNKNINEIISGNWKELQGKIKQQWGEFTDDDIKKMKGSYDVLVGNLEKIYGYKSNEAENMVIDFLRQEGYVDENFAEELWERTREIKDRVKNAVQNSTHELKEKSKHLQVDLVNYVKKNPIKSVGIGAIIGFVAGKLIKR